MKNSGLIPVARNQPFDIAVKKRLVNVHPPEEPGSISHVFNALRGSVSIANGFLITPCGEV